MTINKLAKEDKIKFDVPALIYLMLTSPQLQQAFKNEGFAFEKRLMIIHAESGSVNHKAKAALRKIFNTFIVSNNSSYKKRYTKLLLEQKEKKEQQTNEFSIEIKGAGSKEKIIHDLLEVIAAISGSTLKELRHGVSWEDVSLMTMTNLPEKYY
ncbi:MAG TPA: hypothetical protein VJY62_15065 [Bacteroidia bacterium]|nr:hypothetical protein [Bacteroidia bacterium]